ncbi:MAG TPA: tRNA (adenosine(37)-N6)-threonylcarbamoyltransferase complex dimerization subunit type 1 TsaB [Rhodocyclaceae bacterium]|nr:tRNA (adenosine(37)-N6)-threonylcarbamoyltransferase complex dimerization subunit type 1 TsaB [Rhodocyclaceae bacterium]
MKILALETSCELGSVALSVDGETLERRLEGSGAGHSATILPALHALLAEAELHITDLDAIAFGAGPGSFTGVRLGCGIAQGLALGADKPVAVVSSLLALAEPVTAAFIYCAADARMQEAYVAMYQRHEDQLSIVMQPVCMPPGEVPLPSGKMWCGVGSAFKAYRDAMSMRLGDSVSVLDAEAVPRAVSIARLAERAQANWMDPALAAPEYVRNRVALTIAERLAQGGKA